MDRIRVAIGCVVFGGIMAATAVALAHFSDFDGAKVAGVAAIMSIFSAGAIATWPGW